MSTDSITGFFEKIASDADLQARVKECLDERGEMAAFEIVDIAGEMGFSFTATELREQIAAGPPELELDDAALEAVSGGAFLTGLRARFLRIRGRARKGIRLGARRDSLRARTTKKLQ